jgi:hypothetical protein
MIRNAVDVATLLPAGRATGTALGTNARDGARHGSRRSRRRRQGRQCRAGSSWRFDAARDRDELVGQAVERRCELFRDPATASEPRHQRIERSDRIQRRAQGDGAACPARVNFSTRPRPACPSRLWRDRRAIRAPGVHELRQGGARYPERPSQLHHVPAAPSAIGRSPRVLMSSFWKTWVRCPSTVRADHRRVVRDEHAGDRRGGRYPAWTTSLRPVRRSAEPEDGPGDR